MIKLKPFCLSILILASLSFLHAEETPETKTDGKPEANQADVTVIEMGVEEGTMKYETETFTVAAGSKVKVVLKNEDMMQHNMVICKIGTSTDEIGLAALDLGEDGPEKNYIPASDKILFTLPVVEPGETGTVMFDAPKEAGAYPYVCTIPGHYSVMKGVMHVTATTATATEKGKDK